MSNKPQLVHKGSQGKFTFEIYQVAKTKNLEKGAYFYKFKVYQEFNAKDKFGKDIVAKDYSIPGFMIKEYVEVLNYADSYARTIATGSSADAVTAAAQKLSGDSSKGPEFNF